MYKNIKIENGKIYTTSTLCERKDTFEIVEKIQKNFFVWNIGENMGSDEYIPICEDLRPEDKKNFEINPETLKVIKLPQEEVKLLRDAASVGIVSKSTAEKTIEIFNRITA